MPEAWLRGPLPEYPPALMPVVHALLQAREDVVRAATDASPEELWQRPGDAASAGYHLQHLAGSLDRLFTYARGDSLDEGQRAALVREGTPGDPASVIVAAVVAGIDRALDQLQHTPVETLGEAREVGRARLPSTVLGLLVHAAEHTSRHVGQVITTLKIVRGLGADLTDNKRTVTEYMEGFRRSDHQRILACLTEDVEWEIPGAFHLRGQEAFDHEIENEAFVGSPDIIVDRLTEENDVVVAEGRVRARRKGGELFRLRFCDVFLMHQGKIRHLISYLMEVK
jgi:ketosteroid isomerase-like protein